jgi:hypothetical protein
MQDILKSGNNELLNGLALVYEQYPKYIYGSYPAIEKAHYYYSAYLCYRALGDTKKADKAFKKIPKDMLAKGKDAETGYIKME